MAAPCGRVLRPRLGGSQEQWIEANRVTFERLWPPGFQRKVTDYPRWHREYQLAWIGGMAEVAGVALPQGEQARFDLAQEATLHITSRVNAAYSGVPEAVRALHPA